MTLISLKYMLRLQRTISLLRNGTKKRLSQKKSFASCQCNHCPEKRLIRHLRVEQRLGVNVIRCPRCRNHWARCGPQRRVLVSISICCTRPTACQTSTKIGVKRFILRGTQTAIFVFLVHDTARLKRFTLHAWHLTRAATS